MRVVLTGGGTGGHLTPLIAVTKELQRLHERGDLNIPTDRDGELEILYVGVVSDIDERLLTEAQIPFVHVPSGKIRRYMSGAGLTVIDLFFRLPFGILRALWKMYFLMPEVVFSKGGYGSIPVVVASWIYRIPVLLHETDVVPGLANQRLARFASAIAVGFRKTEEHFPSGRVFVAGTPVRQFLMQLPSRDVALRELQLHARKPVLFVVGGSQGSQRINSAIIELLTKLLPDVQIVHQVGELNLAPIRQLIEESFRNFPDIEDYHLFGFLDDTQMAAAYASATLVISRAGGTTLAEIAAAGKPSILIPLKESANNHQWENAYFTREAGAALVVDETNLAPPLLESSIRKLLGDTQLLTMMASRARELAKPSATSDLAQLLVAMGSGYVPRKNVASFVASAMAKSG